MCCAARTLLRWLALLAATMLAGFSAVTQASMPQEPRRIVAVGDLHGDFTAWQAIAQAAGLTDGQGRWTGGDTVLVQMGDITDRGPDSLKIIHHLQALEAAAPAAGGQVIVLLGNHEAMNVIGDLRYVHPGEYAAFADERSESLRDRVWRASRGSIRAYYSRRDPALSVDQVKTQWYAETPLGALEHRAAWEPGGELGKWAADRPAVALVGGALFAHGGLSTERALAPIETINRAVAAALQPGDAIDRAILEDPLGPLWYRGNLTRSDADRKRVPPGEEIAQLLAYHGASRLVVAHTPSLGGIAASEDGRVIRVDTGISVHYGGVASYLELNGGQAIAHRRDKAGAWDRITLPSVAEVQATDGNR